jgi:bifunctional DNA-binding transcriptional regulator/antitoxin component of YhaV-PrlF toxin-antitoxin module
VTVPIEARDALGLTPGTEVEFLVRESEIVLRKGKAGAEPVDHVYGVLTLPRPVDRLLAEMRGPGPKELSRTRRRPASWKEKSRR